MYYEWRSYSAMPGKMAALNNHLRVAKQAFGRVGLRTLGVWTDEVGLGLQLSYAWAYETLDERAEKLRAMGQDQEWRDLLGAERSEHGQVVAAIESTLWSPARFWPEAVAPAGGVQELRTYTAAPGKLPQLQDRFADHTTKLFTRHGIENVGYWTEVFGNSNHLVYMLSYPDVGARQASWAAFGADPEWQAARAESEKDGPLVASITNRLLRPAPWAAGS